MTSGRPTHTNSHAHSHPQSTHSQVHRPTPTHLGIQLFSLALTGAIHTTKSHVKELKESKPKLSNMHISIRSNRVENHSNSSHRSSDEGSEDKPELSKSASTHSTASSASSSIRRLFNKPHKPHVSVPHVPHAPHISVPHPLSFHKKETTPSSSSSSSSSPILIEDISPNLIPILGKIKFAILLRNLFSPEECASLIELSERQGYNEAKIQDANGEEIMRKDVRDSGRCIVDDEELAEIWFQRVMEVLGGGGELGVVNSTAGNHGNHANHTNHGNHDGSHSPHTTNDPTDPSQSQPSQPSQLSHLQQLQQKFIHAPWAKGPNGEPYRVVGINERLRFLRYQPGQYFGLHQDAHYRRGEEFGERCGEVSQLTFLLYLNDKMKGGETQITNGSRFADVVPRTGTVMIFDHDIWHVANKIVSGTKYACRTDVMYAPVIDGIGDDAGGPGGGEEESG